MYTLHFLGNLQKSTNLLHPPDFFLIGLFFTIKNPHLPIFAEKKIFAQKNGRGGPQRGHLLVFHWFYKVLSDSGPFLGDEMSVFHWFYKGIGLILHTFLCHSTRFLHFSLVLQGNLHSCMFFFWSKARFPLVS